MDDVIACVIIPRPVLRNRIPLRLGPLIVDRGQVSAIGECIFPDARHAVGNRKSCQVITIIECIIPDARHAAIGWNNAVFAT